MHHEKKTSQRAPTNKASASAVDDRLFRTHFESLPGPAFIWQRAGRDFELVAHNRAGAKFGGSRVEALIGISASELYADKPELLDDLQRSAGDGLIIRRELDYRFLSGAVGRLVGTCVPLSRDTVVIHVEDVTGQQAAARALEQSEARMRALFASNPDIVFRMDADGIFLDLHVPETSYFPWDRREMIGRSMADYYGEEAQKQQARYNRTAIDTGEVQVFEYKVSVGDVVMSLESRVARAGDNEVVVSVRDISDRVELERKLTIIGERERNRIGRDIHDGLAQMLTGVKLLIEHLERHLTEEGSKYSVDATRAAGFINDTISQARELVRGLSPIPDGTTLFDGLSLLAQYSEKYLGVSCHTEFSGNVGNVGEAAIAHLYRIAQEAITNAVKHGKATTIELACHIRGGELLLTVADDGIGIGIVEPPADPEGLGLRIMRYRARTIGGEVTLARREARGTIVTCRCFLTSLVD